MKLHWKCCCGHEKTEEVPAANPDQFAATVLFSHIMSGDTILYIETVKGD